MAVRRSSGLVSVLGSSLGTLALLAGCVTVGCSAGDGPGGGSDGNGADGNGDGNGAGAGSNGGLSGVGNGSGGSGQGPNGEQYCDSAAVNFVPQTPTVYVLVDRSGSMGTAQENFWGPLKAGLLPAIESLQNDVRFGFGTYSAGAAAGCTTGPVVDDLGVIGENNYEAIAAKYNSYADPTTGETPTSYAVEEAVAILQADPSPGGRFIALVTDGNPDFCDNVHAPCGQDATVGAIQAAHAAGVSTLVFGLAAQTYPIEPDVMNRFADAGIGLPVSWPIAIAPDANQNSQLYYECNGQSVWPTLPKAAGGDTVGAYSPTAGGTMAFLGTDPAELVTALQATVEGLKSCIFDLGDSGVEVTPDGEANGDIFVEDELIPLDQWHMNTPTVLELTGDACLRWQQPEVTKFFAGFSCAQIIIR